MRNPKPPDGLSRRAVRLWNQYVEEFDISDCHGTHLLTTALQAFDRMERASALIAQHGELMPDRHGHLRPNPACVVERDSRSAMLHALRELHLDVEAPVGHPGPKSKM